MYSVARLLIVTGLLLMLAGLLVYAFHRLGGSNFRMPGDIAVRRKNFAFYFPIVTSIVLSIVLSLAFYLFRRFMK